MSNKMTTIVEFCLSYDPLIAFKINIISIRKRIVDMDVVNDVMRPTVSTVWSYDFNP